MVRVADRVAAVDLIGPVGPDDEQPLRPRRPGDEGEHVPGRAIRPRLPWVLAVVGPR